MFTAAIPIGWLYVAQAAALLLIVPFGLVFFNWIATLAGGALRMRAPMLFALAAISTLSIGLAGELVHSVIPVSWQLARDDRRDRGDRVRPRRRRGARRASRRSTTGIRR